MRTLVCACLAVVALAAGCGGDDDGSSASAPTPVTVTVTETVPVTGAAEPAVVGDEAAIRAVYDDFVRAFLDRDGEAACSHLSPAGEAQAVMEGRRQGFGDDCADAVRGAALVVTSRAGDDVAATLGDVEVSGDSARATAVLSGSEGRSSEARTFERTGGRWYVGPTGG